MWRSLDLLRGYAYRSRAAVAGILDGLIMASPRGNDEVTLLVSRIDDLAALASLEHEFAVTTAVRRIAVDEIDIDTAVRTLDPVDCAHALAVLTTVTTTSALSDHIYRHILEGRAAWIAERTGAPRPYSEPWPV